MAFSNIFKGSGTSGGTGGGAGNNNGQNFMQNASNFFSSVQAKSDDLVTNLRKKAATVTPFPGQPAQGQTAQKQPKKRDIDGDDDSSASEYGDGGDPAMYADEAPVERKLSSESIDSLPEEEANKFRSDIGQFVMAMLT